MAKHFSDKEIIQALEGYAPLENYFINKQSYIIGRGLIMFFNKSGQLFIDQQSDDSFNDACVEYLIKLGAPVFTTQEEIDTYSDNWKARLS